jgi:NDP-sugar pyrophosphorylase family protein
MDVRAILLTAPGPEEKGQEWNSIGPPLALVDVLGRSVLQRTAERLISHGVSAIHIVDQTGAQAFGSARSGMPSEISFVNVTGPQVWRTCETIFSDAAQSGAELMLVLRVGPYTELDYDHLIQFHLDQHNRVTSVCSPEGEPLGAFVISTSRRNDAAYLFRHQLTESRTPCAGYVFQGYWNPLSSGADLRRLTMDAFLGKAAIIPVGREVRPGVWVATGARIDRAARVLAPAFVGAYSTVRASAVVTRFSAVEHHCDVDCGTVIEDSNVLPFTYVGAGLDVAHAIVGNRHLLHLQRNVQVQITDPRLVGTISAHAPLRTLSSGLALAAYLPRQILRGIFPPSQRERPSSLPAAVNTPSAALKSPRASEAAVQQPDPQFPANLVVARRYGNE